MNDLITCDPGKRACGIAHFRDGLLIRAALVQGVSDVSDALAWMPLVKSVNAWVLSPGKTDFCFAVEFPQIYVGAKAKGDNNDLMQLAAVVGGLCSTLPHSGVRIYRPREWKGNVDADIMTARIEKRLSPAESASIEKCRASLKHNVLDAVGIGLKHLHRL